MDKRGFTLVELLAVIIILSLLALLTSTAVTKLVKDAKSDLNSTQLELIKSAAQTWGADNITKLPSTGKCGYLTLLDLKEYGLIDSRVIDPNTNQEISNNLKIKITTTTSSYGNVVTNYEVNPQNIDGCTKIYDTICTAVVDATTPNKPPYTDYSIGNAYDCEVKPGVKYRFFILSTEGNKVNLIMNKNIAPDGTPIITQVNSSVTKWCNKLDYIKSGGSEEDWDNNIMNNKGPITMINYLNQATSNWSNIENLNQQYDDEGGNYTDFVLNGKARIPKLSEVTSIGCSETEDSCPSWLTSLEVQVFGLLDSVGDTTKYAWVVVPSSGYIIGIRSDNELTVDFPIETRPVITVSKYRIQNQIVEES